MANKMIIDASHPEETRVVVLRGNRVEEFDFESASKKQLRGNIYLAKVTRVEPSLQAAFVEYGGNRHGFLAFSEIHPDYYQIPHSDRVALLEEESRAHREEEDEESNRRRSRRHRRGSEKRRPNDDERVIGEINSGEEQAAPADGEAFETVIEGEVVAEVSTEARSDSDLSASGHEASDHGASDDEAPVEAPAPQFFQDFSSPQDFSAPASVEAAAPEASSEPMVVAPEQEAASEPQGEIHAIARDPEGFAIVQETDSENQSDRFADESGEIQPPALDAVAADAAPDVDEEAESRGYLAREQRGRRGRGDHERGRHDHEHGGGDHEHGDHADSEEEEIVEQLGGDAMDETPYRAPRLRRQYKIQEVIKRRQVLLIQVVKEERGNKGAALTTYLSLAGRYSVLMPNTARGGGISRKITDTTDRKRLKEIAGELEVPEGMGVILRTAGAARTKPEIHRDFEYLMRMWEQVRALTLSSSAPALVYEEGSLIKRAIRDLYNKDIDEVVVSGDNGFREARDFMRLLMPSHVKNVHHYRDPQPVFAKWGAEAQLDALFHNQVTLKSGGYLVINQTEALVAIDVNSGRSTREHNIEDTALRTNLEASDEVARQLRLRDLAGLIVVDFIDMEESRNNRAVERRLKEALKDDRARIQVGRISHFGLLEMSRQRIRTGVLEGSSILCPHCAGAGTVRSTASVAVHVMRVLEDALIKSASHNIILRTRTDIALYILNQKRSLLRLIEDRFGVAVTVEADDTLTGGAYHALERGEPASPPADPLRRFDPRQPIDDLEPIGEAELDVEFEEEPEAAEAASDASEAEGTEDRGENGEAEQRRRRRRRRGRGRNFERDSAGVDANGAQPSDEGLETMAEIGGDLIVPVESSDEGEETEGGEGETREGGRRGRGRWRRRGRSGRGEATEFSGDWRPSADSAGESDGEQAPVVAVETGESEASAVTAEFQPQPFEHQPAQVEAVAPQADVQASAYETPQPDFHTLQPSFEAPQTAFEAPQHSFEAPQHSFEAPQPVAEAPQVIDAPAAPVESSAAIADASAETAPVAEETPDAPLSVASAEAFNAAPAPTQPDLPVITEADPNQPKRSGWWARAKANLTGH